MFNLFNVITFRNEPCSSTTAVYPILSLDLRLENPHVCLFHVRCRGGVIRNGTCFTSQECMDRSGGQSVGNCASGFADQKIYKLAHSNIILKPTFF